MDEIDKLKKKVLFDERGMIRGGITSMNDYANVFYAEDEEEVDMVINAIMTRDSQDVNGEEEE